MNRLSLLLGMCCLVCSTGFSQKVILAENFEVIPLSDSWFQTNSAITTDNEWANLNLNSSLSAGTRAVGVTNNGTTHAYVNGTSDHSIWVTPNWPSSISNYAVNVQYDYIADGFNLALITDFMSVYLVNLNMVTYPSAVNLNGSNSIQLAYYYNRDTWSRASITLSAAQKSFINAAGNNVALLFNWRNDALNIDLPPGAFDNVSITTTPSVPQPLNGAYTVGRIKNNDFVSITSAVNYLNAYGLSGDVIFYLTDEDYNASFETFPFIIGNGTTNPFPGMGTHNITFKPLTGSAVTPTITGSNFTVSPYGVFTFYGANNISVDGSNIEGGTSRDLTIVSQDASTTFIAPIFLGGVNETTSLSDITIKNTNLTTNSTQYGFGVIASLYANPSVEAKFDNISITNNDFSTMKEAIHIDGLDASGSFYTTNSLATNVTVADNVVQTNIKERGVHFLGVNNGSIAGNHIGGFVQTDDYVDVGIMIDKNSQNISVEKNHIYSLGYSANTTSAFAAHGIEVNTGVLNANVEVKNNVIYDIGGNGASNSITNDGIYRNPAAVMLGMGGERGSTLIDAQSGINVWNNSIHLYGNQMDFATASSVGVFAASNTTSIDLRNNVIKNTSGGSLSMAGKAHALAVYAQGSSAQFSQLNYNAYFVNAGTSKTTNYVGLLGPLSNIALNGTITMSEWRSNTSMESSSVYGEPGFTSNTNLEPSILNANSWNIHGMGTHIANVTNDYKANGRPATVYDGAPDLGAYEFTMLPAAVEPSASVQPGPLAVSTPYVFSFNQRDWVSITFLPGSDLPDDLTVKFYSGVWAANRESYDISNFYFDIIATENGSTNYLYSLSIYYDEPYLGSINDIVNDLPVIAQDPLGVGDWSGDLAILDAANRKLTVSNLTSFGRTTITTDASPLPIELTSFNGELQGDDILLSWTTAEELNNEKFVIERLKLSGDELQWIPIGEKLSLAARGEEAQAYNFVDYSVEYGDNTYRLKQVDYDGKFSYSGIVTVTYVPKSYFKVYPTIVESSITVINSITDQPYEVVLKNLSGVELSSWKGINGKAELELVGYAAGVYLIEINSEGHKEWHRIVLK